MKLKTLWAYIGIAFVPATALAAPRLSAPRDLWSPRPQAVVLTGLRPHTSVMLKTIRRGRDGKTSYVGKGTFMSDGEGAVSTTVQPPNTGTYQGKAPLGLFWSAAPRPSSASDPQVGVVTVTAAEGPDIIASAQARTEPSSTSLKISEDTPFPGAIWARPLDGLHHPVLIILGGSEGGAITAQTFAPIFAALGYAALGLPYYDPGYGSQPRIPGLPSTFTEIPVDRLASVQAWLQTQPDADANRIGIWGASKGSEFALIAASRYKWIRAVVAIVPTDLVWEGWGQDGPATSSFSFGGKPLPYEPYWGMDAELAKAAKGLPMDLRKVHVAGRKANPQMVPAARIPIERFHGALFVAGAGQDRVWPSLEMARNISAARKRFGESTTILEFPQAGHGIAGPGTDPATPLTMLGGTKEADAKARILVWQNSLEFLAKNLRPSTFAHSRPSLAQDATELHEQAQGIGAMQSAKP